MNINLELRETLRYFLLPISFEKEQDCIEVIKESLAKSTIEEDSIAAYLRNKHEDWKSTGKVDTSFAYIISQVLKTANPENGELFSEKYFDIHLALQSNPFITFELSTITLSHLRLISILAVNEKMSSAKISRVLKSVDGRLTIISWKEVQIILKNLNCLPTAILEEAKELYLVDEELEFEYFADADLDDASYLVGEVAKKLRFQYNAEILLTQLADPNSIHLPYLQILHYQCLISGFYDHVLSVPYEFAPRGNVALWLYGKWDKLVSTSNPILNNAKAVDVLDENWARSKKNNEFENANVLVDLLHGIDGMGFAASQELASWIRQWLIRFIRINSAEIVPIPNNLDYESTVKLLKLIGSKPTATYGILEQRLVDVIASLIHFTPNWRARGLKDSVNTNNTSKRKLGDNDFQDSTTKTIIAYEAHGGKLNRVYYEGHIKTFARSFERRMEELENISDIEEWSITVVFVAFDFEDNLENSFVINGVNIDVEFVTFDELIAKTDLDMDNLKYSFNSLFVEVINNRRTPASVREKVNSYLI